MILRKKLWLGLVSLFLCCQLTVAQSVDIFDLPGAGSWIVPCGVTSVTIAVYGGGGGGGGCNSTTIGGGGGGAGGYAQATFAVTAGQVIPFNVGAGGAAGTASGNGGNGGQSNLSGFSTLFAAGGTGGLAEDNGGGGGAGGNASLWTTSQSGGNGSNGGDPQGGQGGYAGGPNGGGGGPGGGAGVSGGNGSLYGGGGGGGGKKNGGVNTVGGAGAKGAVIFSYTLPYAEPDAGPDVSTCNTIFMQANPPDAPWVGTWNIISYSGSAPVIANTSDPNTQVTVPVAGTCAVLEWEFTQPGCVTFTDQVTVCFPLLCNDDPCGATPLTVNSGSCTYSTSTNVNATGSTGMVEPGCGSYANNDAWYSVTVPASGIVTFQATDFAGGASMYMGMAIYSEGPGGCGDLWHEGCDYATGPADFAQITYTGTPGETIYLRVWDTFETEGSYSVCAFQPASPPSGVVPGMNTIVCGGPVVNFYDPGGSAANYQNNTTAVYQLCPDTPGQYTTVDFTTGALTFATEAGWDYMTVLNGAADSSYMIGQYSGSEATGPGIITSSAPDGCLTLIFSSDNANNAAGWVAAVTCSASPGANNFVCSGTDCPGECGTWICASGLYPTENIGNNYQDITNNTAGCFDDNGEIASQWFYFTALSSGTVELSFAGPGGQDYNFAIYGPSTNDVPPCPGTTAAAPVVCSQADVGNYLINGLTGLSSLYGNGQMYEGSEGDGWVAPLTVVAGETYSMVVNIYQNGGPQPVIDMTIGGTGTLDCTPVYLPVEVHSFNGIGQDGENLLSWVAASQINNDYFELERSSDGEQWELVERVQGAGTVMSPRFYQVVDRQPYYPVTYYRLFQTDFDGTREFIRTIAVEADKPVGQNLVSLVSPNPAQDLMNFTYTGDNSQSPLIVTLTDSYGKAVLSERYSVYSGMKLTLFTEQVAGGTYQLQFQQGEARETRRIVILR